MAIVFDLDGRRVLRNRSVAIVNLAEASDPESAGSPHMAHGVPSRTQPNLRMLRELTESRAPVLRHKLRCGLEQDLADFPGGSHIAPCGLPCWFRFAAATISALID